MSGCSTHTIPQAGARPQRTETSTPWGQASTIPRECDGGVGGVECGVQSEAFRTCLATQPMALHKPVQDHREKRHPHHEGKPVYYPENVVEVLETGTWLNSRGVGGSGGIGGSGGVGGEKAVEVLEVDQFYIAGDADTESKQFKPEDI
ncbi:hypothetical protein B0H14DRAFT_2585366 [Mycena olivaceomarginata]|nr:hypothetical protein B0H14DRAFT_2585366 [Mycena olivaceomarginata]